MKTAKNWTRIEVRPGEKGPLVVEAVKVRVQTKRGRRNGPGGNVGDLPRATRPEDSKARLRLVECAVRDAVAGVRPGAECGASGGRMFSASQGRVGLGAVSSSDVAGLASSSNAYVDSDVVLDAREAAGGKRCRRVSRFRRCVTSLANCCMRNFNRTHWPIFASEQRGSTVANKPPASITGKNVNACHR